MRYAEKDIALLPGYEAHADGHGYYVDTPTGRASFRNAMPMDELFFNEAFGALNISVAHREIAKAKHRAAKLPLNDAIAQHVRSVEIDPAVVASMTIQRRNQPILAVVASDGVNIVDGHHRIARRIKDNLPHIRAYIMRAEMLKHMQVRFYRQDQTGEWVEDESYTRDDEIEAAISGADAMWRRIIEANGVDPSKVFQIMPAMDARK